MAYEKQNFARQSDAMNGNQAPAVGASGSLQVFAYRSADDAQATIVGADYFADEVYNLQKGDIILAQGSDTFAALHVAAVDAAAGTISVVTSTWTAAVAIP